MHNTIANTVSTIENTEIDSTDKHLIDRTKKYYDTFLTLRSPYLKRVHRRVNPHGTAFPWLFDHQKTAQIFSSVSASDLPYT